MTGLGLLPLLLLLLTTCGDPAQETAPGLANRTWAASANTWTLTGPMKNPGWYGTATLLADGRVLVTGGDNGRETELYDPNTGTWTPGPPMNVSRTFHTATLLSDGRVLVAGGMSGSTIVSSAELYDPTAGTWTTVTTPMRYARMLHTATLLSDGRVLVAGGTQTGSSIALYGAELFDPTTGTWSPLADMRARRYSHTATLLPDGKVLLVGGIDGDSFQRSAELFDPKENAWSYTLDPPFSGGRARHTATLLADGKVLITGGHGDFPVPEMSAELYEHTTGKWVNVSFWLLDAHIEHSAALLPSGKVLIMGPKSSELYEYDPASKAFRFTTRVTLPSECNRCVTTLLPNGQVLAVGNKAMLYEPAEPAWTSTVTTTMSTARRRATATLLNSGHVLVAGGNSSAGTTTALASTTLYEPSGDRWLTSGTMQKARWNHTATLLPSGQVLVTGGQDDAGALGVAELYVPDASDPTKGAWSSAGTMDTARWGHTSTLLPTGQVLVVGGENASGVLPSAELFTRVPSPDPRLTSFNPWARVPSLSVKRRNHTATLLPSGQVLVVGGDNEGGILSSAELYDPAKGSWSAPNGMKTARRNHTALLLTDGRVVVMGGESASGPLASVEIYDPQGGNWTDATALGTARQGHVALLLPSGQVMVIAGVGSDGSELTSVEVYNPTTNKSAAAGTLATPRRAHVAALLPTGRVLVAGGVGNGTVLAKAEVYSDDDAGALDSWRPSPNALSVTQAQTFTAEGLRFMGISGANAGNTASSDVRVPLARLMGLAGGGRYPLTLTRFSESSFTSKDVRLPPGPYLLSITANAITGGRIVQVREAQPTPTIQCADPFVIRTSPLKGTAEPNSQVTVFVDGAPAGTALADNLGNWTFRVPSTLSLTGGYHGFSAWSTELPASATGSPKVSPLSAPFPCNVDATPVDTTLLDPKPAELTRQTSASFSFSSEPGATFQCSLDGATFAPCITPVTYNGLADGLHTFLVRAQDVFGNFDPSPASWRWTVDTVVPDTLLASKPDALTNLTTAIFSFSSESGATFQCSLDGEAFATCSTPFTYTSLKDGPHTFSVRALDVAGNIDPTPVSWTWTVDTAGPDTTLTESPPALTRLSTATLKFIASESPTTFECQLDSGGYFPCTSPHGYSGLIEGSHTVSVRAVDAAGNADSTPATVTWRIDITSPDTRIDEKPLALTNAITATFRLSSTEDPVVYECNLDSAGFLPCTSPVTYDNLAEGAHSFSARAVDAASNVDATPISWVWEVDTKAPDTTLNTKSANGNSATFAFTSPEARTTFECKRDGEEFAVCTSPITYTGLEDGTHSFSVRAVDGAGNRDPVPETFSWKVDISAPNTEILQKPIPDTRDTSATFTFSSPDDATATFECSLDSAAFAACTPPIFYTGLTDGPHLFAVRAVDLALLADPSPAFHSWNVDTQLPDTTLDLHPPALTNEARALFDFSSSEASATFQCSLDGAPFATCPSPPAYSLTKDGNHTFAVRATDAAGNVDPSPASYSWTLDTATPDTTLVASSTDTANATFTFSSPEPGASFECKLDSADYAPCTSPATYSSLAETDHTFEVRARDAAGNIDPTPATHTWEVNTAKPDTTIDYKSPATVTKSTFATFVFSASKPGCSFQCSLDNAAFAPCTSPASYSSLGDGPHTFLVFATDTGSRMDPDPAAYTWTVDTTNPDTTLNLRPPELTNQNPVRFAFTTSEPGATFECSLDSAPYTKCPTPFTSSSLEDGPHTFVVRAVDAAGNTDPTPSTWSWTLDSLAPETFLTSKPKELTNLANASFTFSSSETGVRYECNLDGVTGGLPDESSYIPCTSPAAYSLADGRHYFFVRAVDAAGNIDNLTPATYVWTVDTTAPNTTLTYEELKDPSDTSKVTGITFAFASPETGSTFQCRLDTAPFETCTSPVTYNYSTLADTSHLFTVRAVDAAGNIDPTPVVHSWTVPSKPLETTIDYKSPAPVTRITFATFVFSANKPGSTFQCSLDNAAFSECKSPISFSDLADGPHTFLVFAIDAGGRVDEAPASYNWTVDTTNPDTTLNLRPPELTNQDLAQFSFTASEPGSTFQCSADGELFRTCTSPDTYPDLADGTHTFAVRAVDPAGNTDSTPATWSYTVDTAAPLTTLLSKPPTSTGTPFVTFTFSSEASVTFQCKMDEADYATCTSPASYTLSDGNHRFFVRAVDPAGNIGPSSPVDGYEFSITPAPLAPVVKQPADKSVLATGVPTISGEAVPNSTVSVLIDKTLLSTALVSSSGTWSVTPASPLQDGLHTLTATTTDTSNRTSPSSTPLSFTVDTTPPETTIDSGPEGKATSADASFTFSSTEAKSTFECSLDDAEPTPCTSPLAYKGLSAGSHHLKVTARDAVGNKDPSPAERTWTVPKPLDLEGGGGCSSTSPGSPPMLALAGLAALALGLRRGRPRNYR